jgi:hypothetical protein
MLDPCAMSEFLHHNYIAAAAAHGKGGNAVAALERVSRIADYMSTANLFDRAAWPEVSPASAALMAWPCRVLMCTGGGGGRSGGQKPREGRPDIEFPRALRAGHAERRKRAEQRSLALRLFGAIPSEEYACALHLLREHHIRQWPRLDPAQRLSLLRFLLRRRVTEEELATHIMDSSRFPRPGDAVHAAQPARSAPLSSPPDDSPPGAPALDEERQGGRRASANADSDGVLSLLCHLRMYYHGVSVAPAAPDAPRAFGTP